MNNSTYTVVVQVEVYIVLYQYRPKCLSKWRVTYLFCIEQHYKLYSTLLSILYCSYAVIQLPGVTFGLKGGQVSVPQLSESTVLKIG